MSRALRLEIRENAPPWVWYRRLDRRSGYLAWGPVGTLFKRRRPLHWAIALVYLWRNGE
jgi:hypothetical protein